MIVQLRSETQQYPDLTFQQDYVVLGIEADDFRLLNDSGKPYLYPAHLFDVINPKEPHDWITETGDDGERYAYPPVLNPAGFFEDFFDNDPQTISIFWRFINHQFATATAG